jgi:spore coat polysaccharide biosynthesis protein SpsF (cytidylyltransferase family)
VNEKNTDDGTIFFRALKVTGDTPGTHKVPTSHVINFILRNEEEFSNKQTIEKNGKIVEIENILKNVLSNLQKNNANSSFTTNTIKNTNEEMANVLHLLKNVPLGDEKSKVQHKKIRYFD